MPTKQFRDLTPSAGRCGHCRQVVHYMQAKHRHRNKNTKTVEPREFAKEQIKMCIYDDGEWLGVTPPAHHSHAHGTALCMYVHHTALNLSKNGTKLGLHIIKGIDFLES